MHLSRSIGFAIAFTFGVSAGGALDSLSDVQAPAVSERAGILPESGNRLPVVAREDLDEFGRQAYDSVQADIKAGRMLAGLFGPVGIRLWSPRVSDANLRGNLYLRYESAIGRRSYELAVLTTARELDQQFEWSAHEPAAVRAGVQAPVIDIIKHRRPLTDLAAADRLIVQIGREAFAERLVSIRTFEEARRVFGAKNLVDIVSVMAEYAGTAVFLAAFDQQLPAGQVALLPRR